MTVASKVWKGTSNADTHTMLAGTENVLFGFGGADALTASDTLLTGTLFNSVYGGDGNDTLAGGAVADKLFGGNGNDTITTGAGKDYADGGAGSDTITGGSGNQTLSGGGGNDTIISGVDTVSGARHFTYGGDGNDSMTGTSLSTGFNYLYGGTGRDTIISGIGTNQVHGDAGDDSLTGGIGNQSLYGDIGNDVISAGTDTIAGDKHFVYGGAGADSLDAIGSSGLNVLNGGLGDDTLVGSTAGHDTMVGGAGTNVITGNSGNHANETVSYGFVGYTPATPAPAAGYTGATINLTTGVATAGWTPAHGIAPAAPQAVSDTITNVDHVIGSNYNDSITGSLVANSLTGGQGNDTIDGGGTSTSTLANAANTGSDTLSGGLGNDTFVLHNSSTAVTALAIDGGQGTDTLDVSNVTNTRTFVAAAGQGTTYAAGTGNGVLLDLSAGTIAGNAGVGTVTGIEKVIGMQFNDYIIAGQSAVINAGAGNDTILSSQISGTSDTIMGGAGNNVYDGYSGNSSGQFDKFGVGNVATEVDTIYGFNDGQIGDKLLISMTGTSGTTLLGAVADASGTHPMSTTLHHLDNGVYDTKYDVTNTKVQGYTLDAAAVTVYATTALAAANASGSKFVFDGSTGNLYSDSNGAATSGQTQLAHIDLATFTSAHGAGAVIDATDFFLTA